MPSPRLIADEMVGRLARYLRFLGCDTIYARGWSDDEIVRRARIEDRVVVTRDRQLSRRAGKAILLASSRLEDQVRAVRAAFPDLPTEVTFERCTVCNGELVPSTPARAGTGESGVPWDRVEAGLVLYQCRACDHLYWEGSHTAEMRRRLRAWAPGPTE
ncbi:MAG: Mut7-C RNAse domain-containing protein [Thermoplasmata archaeon]